MIKFQANLTYFYKLYYRILTVFSMVLKTKNRDNISYQKIKQGSVDV